MLHSAQVTRSSTNVSQQPDHETDQILSQLISSTDSATIQSIDGSHTHHHQSGSIFDDQSGELHRHHHVISATQGVDDGNDFSRLVSQIERSNSFGSNSTQVFSLADHTDDENDVFQCGKCKQQFCHLQNFVHHKKQCNNNSNKNANDKLLTSASGALSDLNLHFSQLNQQPIHHHQIHHHSIGKNLLNSAASTSSLIIQSAANNSSTSMLTNVNETDLSLDISNHQRHSRHSVSSPTLVDAISGSVSVNSILSETDLLSLTPSLDANMMVTIGNSISPSLLHLQGGDVSSNTDDFAQFAHINNIGTSNDSPISINDSRPGTTNLYSTSTTNGVSSILNIVASSSANSSITNSISSSELHNMHQRAHHSPQSINVMSSLMNSINSTSPTSHFLDMIVSSGLSGTNTCLLKSSFDTDSNHSPSNNSIGSPSRFINLPPPQSNTSTPITSVLTATLMTSSQKDEVKSSTPPSPEQMSPKASPVPPTSMSQSKLTVIHHRPSHQPNCQQQQQHNLSSNSTIKEEIVEEVVIYSSGLLKTASGSSVGATKNVPIQQDSSSRECTGKISSNTVISKNFKCAYCERMFSKSTDLQNHVPCHTGEKPFECVLCGKAFSQKNNLRKHIPTHKITPEEIQSAYKRSLQAFERKKNEVTRTEFNTSIAVSPNKQISSQNVTITENANPNQVSFQANQPQMVFVKKEKLNCPHKDCDFCTCNETELKLHCIDHCSKSNENITFKCNEENCEQVCPDVETFLKHIQAHDRGLITTSDDIKQEKPASEENKKPPKPRSFRCQTCLNRYTTPAALEHHKANTSHHFPCQMCNKVFPCERYLRRHQLTHGAGLYSCKYCKKSFKTANYLKVHLIIHTGEKPFACKICEAAFNRRDKLKRHELVHDPVKRYKCPLNSTGCTREFNRPDKLKAHILTHSGVKPYQCSLCPRSFTRRAHLREHSKTHHELRNNEPSTCNTRDNATAIASSANQTTNTVATNTTAEDAERLNKHIEDKMKSMISTYPSKSLSSDENKQPIVAVTTSSGAVIFDNSIPSISSDNGNFSQLVSKSEDIEGNTNANAIKSEQEPIILLTESSGSASTTSSIQLAVTNNQTTDTANQSYEMVPIDNQQISLLNNYIVIFPCTNCDKCFFKESELKNHRCDLGQESTAGTEDSSALTSNSMVFQMEGT